MQRADVDDALTRLAFDFFFSFSRFEFALKENFYRVSDKPGDPAEPGWNKFTERWRSDYKTSKEARRLLDLAPERQIIGSNDSLAWKAVRLEDCKFDLEKVVRLLKTTRNNLFHGGKSGGAGWDDKERTRELLLVGKTLLDQLAEMAGINDDYRQIY